MYIRCLYSLECVLNVNVDGSMERICGLLFKSLITEITSVKINTTCINWKLVSINRYIDQMKQHNCIDILVDWG